MEIDGSYNFVWILFKVLSTGIFWFVFFFSRYNPYNNAIGSLTKKLYRTTLLTITIRTSSGMKNLAPVCFQYLLFYRNGMTFA